jgi:hypothetical protein
MRNELSEPQIRVTSLYIWRNLRSGWIRLSPAPGGWLPLRHWRRLWLAAAVRLLVALPLVIALSVPYWAALGFVEGVNWLAGRIGHLYVWAANTDRERSGWNPPPPPRAPAPRLNPEWAKRLEDR